MRVGRGNLGAPPNPPHCGSKVFDRCETTLSKSPANAGTRSVEAGASWSDIVTCWSTAWSSASAWLSTTSRWVAHASASALSTRRKLG